MNVFSNMKKNAASFSILIFALTFLIGCRNVGSNEKQETSRIETYASAREIVPGIWVATEKLFGSHNQYDLLIFKKDGSLQFAQGASLEQALRLAKETTPGQWSINEDPNLLNNLKTDQRFLIEFTMESIGSEILRVEIDPVQHRMGRLANEDDALRENLGLYSFGGKIFYKQANVVDDPKPNVSTILDICKCLTEPGNSDYMIKNGEACDEAISQAIAVPDWRKVNMAYDKIVAKRFDDLVLKCTGKVSGEVNEKDGLTSEDLMRMIENVGADSIAVYKNSEESHTGKQSNNGALGDNIAQRNLSIRVTDEKSRRIYELIVADEDLPDQMKWNEANDYCRQLEHSWRLPTKQELEAIYKHLYLKGTSEFNQAEYWSSDEDGANEAWFFDFTNGLASSTANSNGRDKEERYYVRLVRKK